MESCQESTAGGRAVRRVATKFALLVLCVGIALDASATAITYDLSNVAGNTRQYDLTVSNNTLGQPIHEFSVFFNFATFSNLVAVSQPASFAGPLVAVPIVALSQDGFVDYLASDAGIAISGTLGGFVIRVDFSGPALPGAPTFQVVDANFNPIDSGTATPTGATVPEPATLGLFGLGLLGFASARRRSGRR